jgi:uncharacterized protein YgfB (UPF0149 family)
MPIDNDLIAKNQSMVTGSAYTNVFSSAHSMNDVQLARFFHDQNRGGAMPHVQAALSATQQLTEMVSKNMDTGPKNVTMYFPVETKNIPFRTDSMRAWNVPITQTELRTD